MESRVFERGCAGSVGHGTIHRAHRKHVADASAQFSAQVECRECAARLGKMIGGRIERDLSTFESREYGFVSQAQQESTLIF